MSEKERVQFDFTPDALDRLDQIKAATGATTRAETVRHALKVYEWFVQLEQEYVIEIRDTANRVIYRIPVKTFLS